METIAEVPSSITPQPNETIRNLESALQVQTETVETEKSTSNAVSSADEPIVEYKTKRFTTLNDYISNSTIHGLRYFNDHHWLEKTWWVLTFTAAASCCALLITNIYHNWQDNPVHLAFGSKSAKLWQIPYPALTICPMRKFYKGPFPSRMKRSINIPSNQSSESIYSTIREAAMPLNTFVDFCDVAGIEEPKCMGVFSEVMTENGLCYTYNSISHADMFTDKVTPEFNHQLQHHMRLKNPEVDLALSNDNSDINTGRLTYPRRVLGSSDYIDNRFIVRLQQPLCMIFFLCDPQSSGYEIIVHPSQELPFHQPKTTIPLDGRVRINLEASVVSADPLIKNYSPQKRQCYFRYERKLEFFREYSRQNCEVECLAYHALRECQCVSFAIPRTSETPVCINEQMDCWYEVVTNSMHGLLSMNKTWPCDCLPACNEITYSLSKRKIVGSLVRNPSHQIDAVFSFERNNIEIQYRVQQFGRLGFLANCGGLLGLFMGVSLLSLAEFVYFFSIRMLCNLRRLED